MSTEPLSSPAPTLAQESDKSQPIPEKPAASSIEAGLSPHAYPAIAALILSRLTPSEESVLPASYTAKIRRLATLGLLDMVRTFLRESPYNHHDFVWVRQHHSADRLSFTLNAADAWILPEALKVTGDARFTALPVLMENCLQSTKSSNTKIPLTTFCNTAVFWCFSNNITKKELGIPEVKSFMDYTEENFFSDGGTWVFDIYKSIFQDIKNQQRSSKTASPAVSPSPSPLPQQPESSASSSQQMQLFFSTDPSTGMVRLSFDAMLSREAAQELTRIARHLADQWESQQAG